MSINNFSDLQKFKTKLEVWLEQNLLGLNSYPFIIFVSYGLKNTRCKVWSTNDNDVNKVIKRTINFFDKMYEKSTLADFFIKIDVVSNVDKIEWIDLLEKVKNQKHNNHYRKGISFSKNFEIAFLEQEIYGKAIIKGLVYNEPNFFDEANLNNAIKKKYTQIKAEIKLDKLKEVYVFDTISSFYENGEFIPLNSKVSNGVRFNNEGKEHIKNIVLDNAKYLHGEIQVNGKFIYGYFPAYDREIKSYNTVRHCTAIYALLETLEVQYNESYLEKINLSIRYAIETFYKEVDNKAFMIDGLDDEKEIKLGSNAAAIFMFAKYQEITKDTQYQKYAEKLADGIRYMVDSNGETTHVLHYPSLEIKEKFRIVYYDGEAALGLLRLYQLNNNEDLLTIVKQMFDHFINKNYEQYHDHWLSYCTNELTMICPEEKYFKFGLDNYLQHMDFIRNRKTAYATFLEMMMSAYKMIVCMKEQGFNDLYLESKFEELKELIEIRVEFQRSTGFFYPEVAMYMANPSRILNAFYVRHDRFRARIDDQEHNLSGYVAYLNYFHK